MENEQVSQGIWEHFTIEDGLPDMKIECIFEDSRGVLWIGTHDRGVVRYEGDEFKSYDRWDGLSDDGVFSVIEDQEGKIWLSTKKGLTRYDGVGFEQIKGSESHNFLWGSCVDNEGRLWFGAEHKPGKPPTVACWDGRQLEILELSDKRTPSGQTIFNICSDNNGRIWFAGDGLYWFDNEQIVCLMDSSEKLGQISSLHFLSNSYFLIASRSGLYIYDENNQEKWSKILNERIFALCENSKGELWMTTNDGKLWKYDEKESHIVQDIACPCWFGLCFDKVDRLWIGTYGMGLYCYDRGKIQVFHQLQDVTIGSVKCLAMNQSGELWISSGTSLIKRDRHGIFRQEKDANLNEREITALFVDSKERLWMGTIYGEIFLREEQPCKLVSKISEGYSITEFVEDQEGKIWFASGFGGGLGYYEDDEVHFIPHDNNSIYPSWIGSLALSHNNNLWIGSKSPDIWDGLCHYNKGIFQKINSISESSILSLYEDRGGRLWLGTNDGVFCYEDGDVTRFTRKDGLPCEIVIAITQTKDGKLWFGTEGGGACCYDGEIFQTIRIPRHPSLNVIHSIYEGEENQLWWGTEGGLICYTPSHIPPQVKITKVVADNIYTDSSKVQIPDSVSRVSFYFSGKSPVEHFTNLIFRYRLENYDQDWKQTQELQIEYPQLEPGDYLFSVQAIDRSLNYSEIACTRVIVTRDPRIEAYEGALQPDVSKGEFVGNSPAMKMVEDQIENVAQSDLTVLVFGETGTGKGLAARAVHQLSNRSEKPFIHVNCGSLPRELVDSELFGHERGAFTGAITKKLGKFELADNGTIFLDEIGDLPLEAQTRLLRILQERYLERVGGTETIQVDVRVIAATNRDLKKAVREEKFREDLFYRLNVFPIELPLLRERKEDIPLLAEYFIMKFAAHLNRKPPTISEEGLQLLHYYDWPGNVRELEHMLQRAVILAEKGEIRKEHLVTGPAVNESLNGQTFLPLKEFERQYLVKVLEHTDGVIQGKGGAASLLEMHPNTLRSRLQKLGIQVQKDNEIVIAKE